MKITAEKNDTQNAKSYGAISTNPVNPVANHQANGSTKNKEVTGQLSDTQKGAEVIGAVKAEPVTAKFALTLDETLKLVEKLAKKTVQRDRYNGYIKTLEDFVLEQQDEEDFSEDANNYKGCELTIKDSKGNVFYTERSAVFGPTIQFMADNEPYIFMPNKLRYEIWMCLIEMRSDNQLIDFICINDKFFK